MESRKMTNLRKEYLLCFMQNILSLNEIEKAKIDDEIFL